MDTGFGRWAAPSGIIASVRAGRGGGRGGEGSCGWLSGVLYLVEPRGTTGSHARASSLQPGINMGEGPLPAQGPALAASRVRHWPPSQKPLIFMDREDEEKGKGRRGVPPVYTRYAGSTGSARTHTPRVPQTHKAYRAFPALHGCRGPLSPFPSRDFSCCVLRLWEMVGGEALWCSRMVG